MKYKMLNFLSANSCLLFVRSLFFDFSLVMCCNSILFFDTSFMFHRSSSNFLNLHTKICARCSLPLSVCVCACLLNLDQLPKKPLFY